MSGRGPIYQVETIACPSCGRNIPVAAVDACPWCAVAEAQAAAARERRRDQAQRRAALGFSPLTKSRHWAAIALDSALESLGTVVELAPDTAATTARRALEHVDAARVLLHRSVTD